ncbi:MAG: alanine--tRNA ligase [Helicobacteraceae bacterium]
MDVRKEFLEFFKSKGHKILESSPLVPNDPTLLFTNAGMVQFKPVFTGEVPAPKPPRATTSQTCIRAGGKHNDLDNVGYTARHHTFFEMLGNFSFGDYFKKDAIAFAWEFVTQVVKLPKERLWITIHTSDDEAEQIWLNFVPKERIVRMGDKDNFWQMGDTGPCGPCSEIHYDQGAEHFNSKEDYLGGEGDRFLEIWNLVFMQFNRDETGTLHPLPKPSIDTGMGLERIVAIKEGKFSNFDTSLFMPLIAEVEKITGQKYVYETGASFRVIADHIRAVTFLLAQGTTFDKEGRGYVLRRILRRAVRHGYLLGLKKPFMHLLVDKVCALLGGAYPYLAQKKDAVKDLVRSEEERFYSTIVYGMELFNKELAKNPKIFSGDVAFMLYDTYGFPLDLTIDMLRDKNIPIDLDAYEAAMKEQKTRAKASWKGTKDNFKESATKSLLERFSENVFIGYETTTARAKILSLLDEDGNEQTVLKKGAKGLVLLDKTPFYACSGGQVGDRGQIGSSPVTDTQKIFGLILSSVEAAQDLRAGDEVDCVVAPARAETAKHHSAIHLLYAAIEQVLGTSVSQAGSYCDEAKLRFDFTFGRALSADEIARIQDAVNEKIAADLAGKTQILPLEEAKKTGARALFGEKYGESVRVVSFGEHSIEFCGGTHVSSTAQIGSFYITREASVSAGVRRIEGVAGLEAYRYAKGLQGALSTAQDLLKTKDLGSAIERLIADNKELKKGAKHSGALAVEAEDLGGTKLVVMQIGVDLKPALDDIKARFKQTAVMLFMSDGERVKVMCAVKNAPLDAARWLKELCACFDGKGGGKADFASGALNASDLSAIKDKASALAKDLMNA